MSLTGMRNMGWRMFVIVVCALILDGCRNDDYKRPFNGFATVEVVGGLGVVLHYYEYNLLLNDVAVDLKNGDRVAFEGVAVSEIRKDGVLLYEFEASNVSPDVRKGVFLTSNQLPEGTLLKADIRIVRDYKRDDFLDVKALFITGCDETDTLVVMQKHGAEIFLDSLGREVKVFWLVHDAMPDTVEIGNVGYCERQISLPLNYLRSEEFDYQDIEVRYFTKEDCADTATVRMTYGYR